MHKMPQMISMAKTPNEDKEKLQYACPPPSSIYPYGLCISLTEEELEKLNVDYSGAQVGDHYHFVCMAKVTSISCNETQDGKKCRLEMQITDIAVESEEDEYADDEQREPVGLRGHL